MKKKRILILGGAGFLGTNLTRFLLDKDFDITVLDSLDSRFGSDLSSLEPILDRINFIQGDIRDEEVLKKTIPDQDVIYNLTAQTSHPNSMKDPLFDAEINSLGTLKVLLAIKDLNPTARVVYTGSSTLVGRAKSPVIDEDHSEAPLDIYSANKGVAEKYHFIFHNSFGIPTTVLRFANLYGAYGKNDPSFGFVNFFIEQAREGKELKIFGDGMQKRNVMYAKDACEILHLGSEHPELVGKSYFATHDDHHSVRDIAEAVAREFGTKVTYIDWPAERKLLDVDSVSVSSKRIKDITNWKAKYSLEEGLKDVSSSLSL